MAGPMFVVPGVAGYCAATAGVHDCSETGAVYGLLGGLVAVDLFDALVLVHDEVAPARSAIALCSPGIAPAWPDRGDRGRPIVPERPRFAVSERIKVRIVETPPNLEPIAPPPQEPLSRTAPRSTPRGPTNRRQPSSSSSSSPFEGMLLLPSVRGEYFYTHRTVRARSPDFGTTSAYRHPGPEGRGRSLRARTGVFGDGRRFGQRRSRFEAGDPVLGRAGIHSAATCYDRPGQQVAVGCMPRTEPEGTCGPFNLISQGLRAPRDRSGPFS